MAKKKTSASTKSKRSPKLLIVIIAALAVVMAAILFVGNLEPSASGDIDLDGQPVKGEENAVNIVEFGDYKCPACKNFHESMVPMIERELVETGDASFTYMNYPFLNVDSSRAALYAETVYGELGNDTFWEFHDRLFTEQDPEAESQDFFTEERLNSILEEIVSAEEASQVSEAFQAEEYEDALETDTDYVSELGVQSTPTLFVNGEQFEGGSFEELRDMVEEAANE